MLAAALGVAACTAAAVASDDLPKGNVVIAKTHPDAVLIWDATPRVLDLVNTKTLGDAGVRALELDALHVLEARAKTLSAPSVQLRIVYTRTGEMNPLYGTPSFAGVERVAVLAAKRNDILRDGTSWESSLKTGSVPKGLDVTVTGKLPPPK